MWGSQPWLCVFQVSVMNVAIEDFINWKTLEVKGSGISVLQDRKILLHYSGRSVYVLTAPHPTDNL